MWPIIPLLSVVGLGLAGVRYILNHPRHRWTLDVSKASLENESLHFVLRPDFTKRNKCNGFVLEISNKNPDSKIEISWEKSKYVLGGASKSGFLMSDMNLEKQIDRPVKSTIVLGHATLHIVPEYLLRKVHVNKPGSIVDVLPDDLEYPEHSIPEFPKRRKKSKWPRRRHRITFPSQYVAEWDTFVVEEGQHGALLSYTIDGEEKESLLILTLGKEKIKRGQSRNPVYRS